MANIEYDIVVYGATGFTGGLVVKYLAQNTDSTQMKWAIAGRDLNKLFKVKNSIVAEHPDLSSLGVIVASNEDEKSLERLAQSTKVVITTAGPYLKYGEQVVKSCVEAGTHCLDLSGEPNYVDHIYKYYDFPAQRSGSVIINSCGFDSVPADLGALYTALQLGQGDGKVIQCYVSVKGSFSGGTLLSAIEHLEQKDMSSSNGINYSIGKKKLKSFHYQKLLKKWSVPMPVIDPIVVGKSSRAHKNIYGNDFSYAQYIGLDRPWESAGLFAGVGALLLASKFSAVKEKLVDWKSSGEGPSEEERTHSHFKVSFIGSLGEKHIVTSVSGGDPGYTETSKMIAEAALLLVENGDEYKDKGGVHTPAGVLGQKYIEKLQQRGILFERVK